MRGIILAAGRGSRLHHKTDHIPKCLVELSGTPLLHWQLKAMRKAGIERIMVVRGYLKETITGDFTVRDNHNWQQTNMVASLLCAEDWLKEEPCIISYADIIYTPAAVTALLSTPAPLAVLYDVNWLELWQQRFTDPLTDAESFAVDATGTITDIGRKNVTLPEIHGQYMGLLKITPEALNLIKTLCLENEGLCEKLDMTGLLSGLINKGHTIKGIPFSGPWCEIDNIRDIEVAEKMVKYIQD